MAIDYVFQYLKAHTYLFNYRPYKERKKTIFFLKLSLKLLSIVHKKDTTKLLIISSYTRVPTFVEISCQRCKWTSTYGDTRCQHFGNLRSSFRQKDRRTCSNWCTLVSPLQLPFLLASHSLGCKTPGNGHCGHCVCQYSVIAQASSCQQGECLCFSYCCVLNLP